MDEFPFLLRWILVLNLRFPIRVSKCAAIAAGSCPIVNIDPRILFRYASTIKDLLIQKLDSLN